MAPVKPTVQPSTENYPAQEHEHMKDLTVQNYDPDAATDVIDAWTKFGTKFRELAHDFHKIVNDSHGGWSGEAAEGVRLALAKVGKFADDTGSAFHATAGAIAVQRDAAVRANRSMPAPVEFSPVKIAGKWAGAAVIAPPAMIGGAVEMFTTHAEKQEAKQEAVRVMQQRDTAMLSAAQSMPAMDSTPEVTKDQDVVQPSHTTHTQSLSDVSTFRTPANTGMSGIPSSTGTTTPAWVAPAANQTTQAGGNQTRQPAGMTGVVPPGARPPINAPGGAAAGRGGASGRGTVSPGAGGLGTGSGRAGSRGTGPNVPGRGPGPNPGAAAGLAGISGRGTGTFGPANPGGGAGVTGTSGPGAAGAAGTAGRAGAAGGAGVGPAGQAKGEEDKEHKANYLVPTDEFFDDDRMVAPSVIGE
ncbi:hypothetical protein [Lentzea sp.]|uniref:hypothetical protein n=1 Tax=Lentzea sp. TaxID=56099 RepID=UPI002ED21955